MLKATDLSLLKNRGSHNDNGFKQTYVYMGCNNEKLNDSPS